MGDINELFDYINDFNIEDRNTLKALNIITDIFYSQHKRMERLEEEIKKLKEKGE